MSKPDVQARLQDVQTLPRKTLVLGGDFVQLVRTRIDAWSRVAKRAKVEAV